MGGGFYGKKRGKLVVKLLVVMEDLVKPKPLTIKDYYGRATLSFVVTGVRYLAPNEKGRSVHTERPFVATGL